MALLAAALHSLPALIVVAVELAGILGALLAIPAASIIQVIARDLWDHRRGRPKPIPTVGTDKETVSAAAGAVRTTHDPIRGD